MQICVKCFINGESVSELLGFVLKEQASGGPWEGGLMALGLWLKLMLAVTHPGPKGRAHLGSCV